MFYMNGSSMGEVIMEILQGTNIEIFLGTNLTENKTRIRSESGAASLRRKE